MRRYLKRFNKSWKKYSEEENFIDGKLVAIIDEDSEISDLIDSIVKYMKMHDTKSRFRVEVSKFEEESIEKEEEE